MFVLDPGAWHGTATERLWAEPLGGRRYRLRNTPFFAFGVSTEDIVFANEKDGQLVFAGVSIASGHSSYRLRLNVPRTDPAFAEAWAPLEALGCTYEEGEVLAVDVPPRVNIHEAYRLLTDGESKGLWEFDEGHCGHPLDRS
jgi:hypothetical protein